MILDASGYLRASQGDRRAIELLRDHVYGRIAIVVPSYFYIEVANALRTSAIRGAIRPDRAVGTLSGAQELRFEIESGSEIFSEALEFALRTGTSAYDAGYAALALRRSLPLVTADSGLAQAASSAGLEVTLLSTHAD